MIHIHMDAVGGIAGDMFVSAMLDAFPEHEARVMADAMAVIPPGAGVPVLSAGQNANIACRRFGLRPGLSSLLTGASAPPTHSNFGDLVTIIGDASLTSGTAEQAVGILTLLARAESVIHGVALENVHFHELADWDSLLDVVAAGSVIAAVGPAHWTVSPLPRGGGLVRTQHGMLPIPAPAAANLLAGFTMRDDGVGGERVTPTGAAVLAHVRATNRGWGQGRLLTSGTGGGTRELKGMPNILRILAFETAAPLTETVTVVAFEVDDMTGEEIGTAVERLRALPGVLDLTVGTVIGKKSRPMSAFQLVVRPDMSREVMDECFLQTATIGLRWHDSMRHTLSRETDRVGEVHTKSVTRPGGEITTKAESDDLRGATLAVRRGLKRSSEVPS